MTKSKTLFLATLTALAATFGTSALAQEATPEPSTKAVSTKSRTQVAAELAQARADGTISATAPGYDFVKPMASTKTRAEVRAELDAARASGEFADLNGEAPDVVAMGKRGRTSNVTVARGSAAR
jgi:uncharacterized protein YdbL (DUF1318 family)